MNMPLVRQFLLAILPWLCITSTEALAQDRSPSCTLFEVYLNALANEDVSKATVQYNLPSIEQDLEKIRANKWVRDVKVYSAFPTIMITLDPGVGTGIFDIAYEWQMLDSIFDLRVEEIRPTMFP